MCNALIRVSVTLGEGCVLGEFVILGEVPRNLQPGALATRIGASAVIRSHTVIYAGNEIGEGFQTGHGVLVREMNQIGRNVSIGSHSIVEHHVQIGNAVRIHSNAFIPEYSILEDGCWIGPGVVFTNARYPMSSGVKNQLIGPRIECNAKIGAGAVILPGIRVGRDALIGAGSVVVKDVPPGAVVVGNPGHVLKEISDIEEYAL